jgi:acylphosphatase
MYDDSSRRSDRARFEAVVHGIVQGVFFRHNTRLKAEELGLVGTVANRPDGTVRVVAEGSRGQLDALAAWLRIGPDAAVVNRVELSWAAATDAFRAFRILR